MTGLTPFEVLQREAKAIGYRLTDKDNKLILEPEARPEFTDFVLDEEHWIKGSFGDQARGGTPTPGTPTSQSDGAAGETKAAIDRQTGQPTALAPNNAAGAGSDTALVGPPAPKVSGTPQPTAAAPKPAGNGSAAAKPQTKTGPEYRKNKRTEGNTEVTEEVTIVRKEEATRVVTTTTTVVTKITITQNSGTKAIETTVEEKIGTSTGTSIITKKTVGGTTTTTTTSNAEIDPKFQKAAAQSTPRDAFGLPKQLPGAIDLEDGRAEAKAIADESKRTKGYESSAELLTTEETLQLVPGQVFGLSPRIVPEPFDREWRISEVAHDWASLTTSISFYTPQAPPPESAATTAPGQVSPTNTPPGKLANPMPGTPRGTPWDPAGAIRGRPHTGIDMAGGNQNAILASEAGTVTYAVGSCRVGDKSCGGGYGNAVEISHEGQWAGWKTFYAHLASITVKQGDRVQKGQRIGTEGDTGHSSATTSTMRFTRGTNGSILKSISAHLPPVFMGRVLGLQFDQSAED
jgi:murein DD-endopeptidase MepM/ murein hydrolase activator NlpD